MFAYCLSNPVNLNDSFGYASSIKGIINPHNMLYGDVDNRFVTIHIPSPATPVLDAVSSAVRKAANPAILEWNELVSDCTNLISNQNPEALLNTFPDIMNNEFVDTPMAVHKIVSGSKKMSSGIAILVFPFPTPIDEIYGAYQITFGFRSIVYGIGSLFNWEDN